MSRFQKEEINSCLVEADT